MKATLGQIRAALASANPDIRLYLLHGPDEAGARDLAATLAQAMGADAERIDLEPALLRSSPGRLADEAASLSLFGGARHIRITGAGDDCAEAFGLLLDAPLSGNPVVAVAPSLKATSKAVKLALAARNAMSFACYMPEGAGAEQLVSALAREMGLRTVGGSAGRIVQASGGDRAVMTRELEKLALFLDAGEDRPREIDDAALDAVGADLGDSEIGRAIDAAIDGHPDALGAELARLECANVSPIVVLRALVRRLMTLAELRAAVDAGASIAQVTDRIFFRERELTARALRHWRSERIASAIDRVRMAERDLMNGSTAGTVLAQTALIAVARIAERQR